MGPRVQLLGSTGHVTSRQRTSALRQPHLHGTAILEHNALLPQPLAVAPRAVAGCVLEKHSQALFVGAVSDEMNAEMAFGAVDAVNDHVTVGMAADDADVAFEL